MKKSMVVAGVLLGLMVMISACSLKKPIQYLVVGTPAEFPPL